MQTAVFYGASDDLVEVEGVKGGDEFTIDGKDGATFVLGTIRIRLQYGAGGVWSGTIGQITDGTPLPNWPIRILQQPDSDYSVRVEVDCPDDVVLVREFVKRD